MNYIKTSVVIALLLLTGIGCSLYYNGKTIVEAELVSVEKIKFKRNLEHSYFISRSRAELNSFLYSWIGDTSLSLPILEYANNDYLVTLNMSLKIASYYTHINHPRDDCDYLEWKPLVISFRNKQTDSIYFYAIEKYKYRNLCP